MNVSKIMLTTALVSVSLGLTACNGGAALISTKETKTQVLIPTRIGASTRTKPVCIGQREETPEDSKRAATYYREVCIPAWNDKWETLNDEIDERFDWMESERIRIEKRDKEQSEE